MNRSVLAVAAVLCLFSAGTASAQCPSVSWGDVQTQSSATAIRDLVALDLDNDGKLDLVGQLDTPGAFLDQTLYSWRGHGDGTFDAPVSLNQGSISSVRLADVNNDGRPDVVMSTFNNKISVRLNLAGGGLSAPVETNISFEPFRLTVGNFDGDVFPDVAVSGYYAGVFGVYHGVGNGTFTLIRTVPATEPIYITAGDFDGDGRTDVAHTGPTRTLASVNFRNVDGTFTAPVDLPMTKQPSALAAGDFNEDGKTDLVGINWEDYSTIPLRSIMVWIAGPSRTFTRTVLNSSILNSTASWSDLKVADVNGDNHLDIIAGAANGGLTLTFLGNGDGTFRSAVHRAVPDVYGILLADVDGDTRPDLVVSSWNGLSTLKNNCATHVHLYPVSKVITQGQPSQLRAIVSAVSPSTPLPRGTVTFKEGSTVLGSGDVGADGIASLDYLGLPLGVHTIHAEFGGNSELGSASSRDVTEEVITETSSVRMILPANAPSYGTPYLVDAEITTRYGYTVYGWIVVLVDGVETQQGWAGSVTKTPVNLTPGPHTLAVRFYGDDYNPPSVSTPANVNVAKASTVVSLTSGALTVHQGTAHSLVFQVNGPQGTVPAGTLQLKRGSTVLASVPLVNGTANVTATLERGSHDVTAIYSGDANFNPSAANLTLTVLPNVPVAIEARASQSAISIRTLVPPNTTSVKLYRRLGGTNDAFTLLSGWSPAVEFDNTAVRGVLYEYRVEAMVNGVAQLSNVDSAILFTDDGLVSAQTVIHHTHFDELRLAVNALRATAGLAPFSYDNLSYGALVRASHLAAVRTALTEARQALGMYAATYTDPASAGTIVRAVQIQELRELAR